MKLKPKIFIGLEQIGLGISWHNLKMDDITIRGLHILIGPVSFDFCVVKVI